MSQGRRIEGWPASPGEVAALIRAQDWATTPLGPDKSWSERLRGAVEQMLASPLVSTLAVGPDRVLLYNDAAARLYGDRHPGALGRPLPETWPGSYAIAAPHYERAFAGEPVHLPAQPLDVSRTGGEVFDVYLTPVRDERGVVLAVHMTGFEVSERAHAEAALREGQERQAFLLRLSDALRAEPTAEAVMTRALQMLFEQVRLDRCYIGIYRLAEDTGEFPHQVHDDRLPPLPSQVRLSDFPEALQVAFDRTLVIDDVVELKDLSSSDRANLSGLGLRALIAATLRKGESNPLWAVVAASSGPRVWTQGEVSLVEEVAERTWAAVERARADAELSESEARFRNMADHAPVMMWVTDASGACTYLNRAWYEFTGQTPETSRGFGWLEATHPDDKAEAERIFQDANSRAEPFRLEYRLRRHDGEHRWAIDAAAPRFGPGGEFLGYVGSVTDIHERKATEAVLEQRVAEAVAERAAAEEQLRQAQKMEAMGQLTGGVAHDFNNLLTPIIGSLDRLVTRGLGSERERRLMAGALDSAERAKVLVQRLLAFARRQPLQPVAVDVGALVQDMAGLLGSTLGPTIEVGVELAPDLPPAKADANQLEMALLNLAVNSRDAMPEGGRLTVAAERVSVRSRHAATLGLKQGHYVRVSVSDTGVGMDEATRARAVEPFFSTKGVGRGTGLGLSMVHGLAAQLGGGLIIDSTPGRGTTVELWLPVSTVPVGETVARHASEVAAASRGCALLVDDEDLVRMSTADMLADLGFEVLEAGSAEEALRLLHEGTAIDLLVTDHLMPGMSGAELAREARTLRRGLPVLIVSGYAEVEGIAPDLPRLVKPFRVAELAERVAALMPGLASTQ